VFEFFALIELADRRPPVRKVTSFVDSQRRDALGVAGVDPLAHVPQDRRVYTDPSRRAHYILA
jgi:hypothetical protein